MIAILRGEIIEKFADTLVLDVGGVGYELNVAVEEWGRAKVGVSSQYYIYEQIREDAHNLYGFSDLTSRLLFTQLIGVSGVGPKLAMQLLSASGEGRLRQAIATGDPELLKGITGVGPKTAQRVVLELRGKIEMGLSGVSPVTDSVYQALVALGYTSSQATEAVTTIPNDVMGEADRLKAALKNLGR